MIKVESRNRAYILQKWNSIKFSGCEEEENSAALRSVRGNWRRRSRKSGSWL